MCGIIGYIGEKSALPILNRGLQHLEYRGYDSAGVAVLNSEGFQIVKKPGKVEVLSKILEHVRWEGDLGIGHTRWATHGEVNELNAHPHSDCTGEIVLVHNGIIENYQELKSQLIRKGHNFRSHTDTEVIAHLIEEYYDGDLEKAALRALPELKGSFALVIASQKEPDKIIAARFLSPLVLGVGQKGFYVASDVTALIEETRMVIYLDDGELAVLRKHGFEIKDFTGKEVIKTTSQVNWDVSRVSKNGFPHFMLKEIQEQPEVLKKGLSLYLTQDQNRVQFNIEDRFFKEVEHLYIVACGTAYHAALIAEYLIENLARVPVTVDTSSEFRYREPVVEENTVFVCISQSGETADTLASLRLAKKLKLKTLAIVNVEGSTIAREADEVIYTQAGPEIGVASTKAYLTQILVLQLLALKLAEVRQKKAFDFVREYLQELKKVPVYLDQLLEQKNKIESLARTLYKSSNFLYLGRGINYPNALEGALKLKEISYIHAEGYPGGEMKHGPIALIEEGVPVVAITPEGRVRDKMLSNILEVKARQGRVIGIISEGDKELGEVCDNNIYLPQVWEEISPLLVPVPLQLLAYYIAVARGCDVDRPRNLAKSVTVE